MRGSCKGELCILLGWRAGKSLPGRCRYILPLELQTRVLLTVRVFARPWLARRVCASSRLRGRLSPVAATVEKLPRVPFISVCLTYANGHCCSLLALQRGRPRTKLHCPIAGPVWVLRRLIPGTQKCCNYTDPSLLPPCFFTTLQKQVNLCCFC